MGTWPSQMWWTTYKCNKCKLKPCCKNCLKRKHCCRLHKARTATSNGYHNLQRGWKEYFADNGGSFYVGPSGVSQWEKPAMSPRSSQRSGSPRSQTSTGSQHTYDIRRTGSEHFTGYTIDQDSL